MEQQAPKTITSINTIQDYLSIGYLYLLILGILSDSIYYGLLGINILSYSTILDVLLSPIVKVTDNLIFPVVVFIVPIFFYFYLRYLQKASPEKMKQFSFFKSTQSITRIWLSLSAWVILSAYVGYGIGGSSKVKEQLQGEEVTANYRIFFNNKTPIEVKKVGNNSEYIFFIEQGSNEITISPIKNNILKMELIKQ